MALKADLTVNERIKAAYMYYVLGIEQNAIAVAFEVNAGRVNEAIKVIRMVSRDPKEARIVLDKHAPQLNRRKTGF